MQLPVRQHEQQPLAAEGRARLADREVGEQAGRERRAVGVAGDGDFPPARRDLDAESVFEKPQVFVVDTEERAEPGLGKGERNGVGSDVSARLREKEYQKIS